MSVLTAGHDVADARLHREVSAMVRAGLQVEVLGLGAAHGGPAGARVRTWPRGGLVGRALRAVGLPWLASGRVLLTLDPEVAVTATVVGRIRRRRVVVDVHEDYAALLRDRRWARGAAGAIARGVVGLATRAAVGADLTVVADDHVPPRSGCRTRLVVTNAPDPRHVRGDGDAAPTADGSLRAVYIGDLRASRGLRTMLEAVAAAPGWHLDLVGPVAAADAGWVEQRVARDDLGGRVRLHGRLPPARAWDVGRRAQVGLVLLEDTPAFREAVPSKLLEYLTAGLAVLATPLPRVADLVTGSGAGVLVADAAEAAAALGRWADRPDELAAHRAAARRWTPDGRDRPDGYDRLAAAVGALARPAG